MFVYVISAGPMAQKIGVTSNLNSRLAALQTGHYTRLSLEFSIETENAMAVEKLAHTIASETRLYGEWFEISAELAESVVMCALNRLVDDGDPLWALRGGWSHSVGDRVECRFSMRKNLPGRYPEAGCFYTISNVLPNGTVDVAEVANLDVSFCPSNFWPTNRSIWAKG